MEILIGITVIVLVIWAVKNTAQRVAADQARKEDEQLRQKTEGQTADACRYIAEANRARTFSAIPMFNVNAQRNEFGLLHEATTLFGTKTRRLSLGAGTQVKIGKIPLYLGGSQSTPYESIEPVADGDLYLSNRRLIFLSDRRSATVALKDVIGLEATLDGITIHTAKRQKPLVFQVGNPALWSLLVRVFSAHEYESPFLPDGVTIRADATDTPGEINFAAQQTNDNFPAPA